MHKGLNTRLKPHHLSMSTSMSTSTLTFREGLEHHRGQNWSPIHEYKNWDIPILSAPKGTPYGNLSALRSYKDLHSKILSVLKSYLETSSFLRALSDKQSWPSWCSQGTVLAFAQKRIKTRLDKLPPLNRLQKPSLFLFIKSHCLSNRKERVGIIFIFSRSV